MNIPLMILENAACEAKRAIAAKTPAPAKRVTPNVFNFGIVRKIKTSAPKKTTKLTAFFRNRYLVGSEFNFFEDNFINLSILFRNAHDINEAAVIEITMIKL